MYELIIFKNKPPNMLKKILSLLVISIIPLTLLSQKKTIARIQFRAGYSVDNTGNLPSNGFKLFYPIIYGVISKKFEVGIGYNSLDIKYYVREGTGSTNYTYYSGKLKNQTTSLYLKMNFKIREKAFFYVTYIPSISKGRYNSPVLLTGSEGFQDPADYGNNTPSTSYLTRMSLAEEKVLEKTLSKTKLSHGAELGFDLKITPLISFIYNIGTVYSISGFSQGKKDQPAFPVAYKQQNSVGNYSSSPQAYIFTTGFSFSFRGGKKTLIR